MVTHKQRKKHAEEHREQRQEIILDPDHLVIQAENVFPDEPGRRLMSGMRYG